jgi:hypothetical protein
MGEKLRLLLLSGKLPTTHVFYQLLEKGLTELTSGRPRNYHGAYKSAAALYPQLFRFSEQISIMGGEGAIQLLLGQGHTMMEDSVFVADERHNLPLFSQRSLQRHRAPIEWTVSADNVQRLLQVRTVRAMVWCVCVRVGHRDRHQ